MSRPAHGEVYREPGTSRWPLLWGPVFALIGYLFEVFSGLPAHPIAWLLAGMGLLVLTMLWIWARNRFLTVRVTDTQLWQGQECLPLDRIAEIEDVQNPAGARVLGGGWSVPRKYAALPLRLQSGVVVLAWARDLEALQDALRSTMTGSAS